MMPDWTGTRKPRTRVRGHSSGGASTVRVTLLQEWAACSSRQSSTEGISILHDDACVFRPAPHQRSDGSHSLDVAPPCATRTPKFGAITEGLGGQAAFLGRCWQETPVRADAPSSFDSQQKARGSVDRLLCKPRGPNGDRLEAQVLQEVPHGLLDDGGSPWRDVDGLN